MARALKEFLRWMARYGLSGLVMSVALSTYLTHRIGVRVFIVVMLILVGGIGFDLLRADKKIRRAIAEAEEEHRRRIEDEP